MITQKTILFIIWEYGEFATLFETMKVLKKEQGDYDIRAQFLKPYYRVLREHSLLLEEEGIAWLDYQGRSYKQIEKTDKIFMKRNENPYRENNCKNKHKKDNLLISFLKDSYSFVFYLKRYYTIKQQQKNMLKAIQPSVVVTGGDSFGYEVAFLIKAAMRMNIKTIRLCVDMVNDQELKSFVMKKPSFHKDYSLMNKLVYIFFDKLNKSYVHNNYLRFMGAQCLALKVMSMCNSYPFLPNSEPVSLTLFDSCNTFNVYQKNGIAGNNEIVGSVIHDNLVKLQKEAKQDLCQRYHFLITKPLLVCGWPANIFSYKNGEEIEFKNYHDLSLFWVNHLLRIKKMGWNIFLTVHPKSLPQEYNILNEYQMPFTIGEADKAIAACDLFTSINGTSITALAIISGKPVILYDCYQLNYDDFKGVKGCAIKNNKVSFVNGMEYLCANANALKKLENIQQKEAKFWGELDGNSSKRIYDIITNMANQ